MKLSNFISNKVLLKITFICPITLKYIQEQALSFKRNKYLNKYKYIYLLKQNIFNKNHKFYTILIINNYSSYQIVLGKHTVIYMML